MTHLSTSTYRRTCDVTGYRRRDCFCEECDRLRDELARLEGVLAERNCPYMDETACEAYFDEIERRIERLEREL